MKCSFVGYFIPYPNSTLLQGFPNPHYFIPALQSAGVKIDFVNLYDIKQKYGANEITKGLDRCRSNNVILSYWDYIYNRDLNSIFSDPKKNIIFQVNWNEEPRTFLQKKYILERSIKVTLSQDYFKQDWLQEMKDIDPKLLEKIVIWRFPCTRGITYNKNKCREQLGIITPYSIIIWGYYGPGKGSEDILSWVQSMTDTTVLFCGTPVAMPESINYLQSKARDLGMEDRVRFSKPFISDKEADVWMSAADIGVIPYWYKIGESSLSYLIGHNKCVITSNIKCFPEYEKQGTVIMTSKEKFKDKMIEVLHNPQMRIEQEVRARDYADKYNWTQTGIQFRDMFKESEKKGFHIFDKKEFEPRMKILMLYPVHPALVLQLADMFPKNKYVMFQVSGLRFAWEQYLRFVKFPDNVKLISTSCSLFPNPAILEKHLENNYYDACILTARNREYWNVLKNTKIPTVWVALSSGIASLPPDDFTGKIVSANDVTTTKIKAKSKMIYIYKPRSMLPHWIGIEPKGYFMPKSMMTNRIYGEDLKIWQACEPYLRDFKEYLPEEEYNILRSCSRFYIEISHRDSSSVLCESLIMGIPCIAPNRPDYPLYIKHEVNGFLYNNLEEAVGYCKQLSENFKLAQQMSSMSSVIDKVLNEKEMKKRWKEVLHSESE